MSAIVSLLRVMTLRDAEAITLEPGKPPALRRRGQVEALAMPALDPAMLEAFARPLLAGKSLADGPMMVTFVDPDGTSFPVTIEEVAAGLRLVVRRATPKHKPAPAPPANRAVSAPPSAAPGSAAAGSSAGSGVGPGSGSSSSAGSGSGSAPIHGAAVADYHDLPAHDAHDPFAARARLHALLAAPVAFAHERGASDILLSSGQSPRLRIDGRLEPLDLPIDDSELVAAVRDLSPSTGGISADLSLDFDGARVRVNAFDHLGGHAVVARLVRDHVPTLDDLGLPPELSSIVDLRDGLVLVCGPTGSGKSTTLASLIDLLDQRRAAHVITLEDPIEYRFQMRRCLIHQRELGTHIPSFAAGLRSALREAPDVILLGELRDRDTIAAALTAAETGHLVLATLHAPNAVGAIDRMIDAFPDAQQRTVRHQLAACLRVVVTQFLLPRKDGGRAPAIELVPITAAVGNIMRKGDLHMLSSAIQSGRDVGMIPLERSLIRLVESGAVSSQAVKKIAADQDLLASLAGKLR